MNTNKIKWLYRLDKVRYHSFWRLSFQSEKDYYERIDEEEYWNFPCIRRKSGFKRLLKQNDVCKEFGVKGYPIKDTEYLDPYQDENVKSWSERKSWKRNSKRKHQWKNK
jgi:hypothetical protein